MAGIGEKPAIRSGPMFLDGVHHRSGDNLQDGIPVGASQTAFAARLLPPLSRFGTLHQTGPGIDRIVVVSPCAAPQVDQCAANVRVLHTQRAIEIPTGGDATLTAAWFVGRNARLQGRIVEPLHLPGDDSVLDMDVPGTPARAVHAVSAPHDLVVLPSITIELFPLTTLWVDLVPNPGDRVLSAHQ